MTTDLDIDTVWNYLLNKRDNEELQKLNEEICVPNSFTHKEYRLTHRFKSLKNAFLGVDNNNNKYYIKAFGVQLFKLVKFVYDNLETIDKLSSELDLLKVDEIIEIHENDRWVMFLITPYIDCFTIEEVTEALHKHNMHISKEQCINIYLKILSMVEIASSKNLKANFMPDNLLIINPNPDQLGHISLGKRQFNLKILSTSLHAITGGKSKLERLYPEPQKGNHLDRMIWGAGVCLYAFVSQEPLSKLPTLSVYHERDNFLKFFYKDEDIFNVLKMCFAHKKPANFLTNFILKIWRALINKKWEDVDNCSAKQISTLFVGLTFETPACRMLALRKILLIAQDYSGEVCSCLSKNDMLFIFVENCLIFDWHTFPDLLNSVFMVLKDKLTSRSFKERLVSMNFFTLIVTAIDLKANTELLCDFIQKFHDDNTLTILQIVWSSGFVENIMNKPSKTLIEVDFIKSTMSYYGNNSVEFIKKVYENIEISESRVAQHLLEIPYYFKLEHSQLAIQLMEKIIERNARNQGDTMLDVLKTIVLILAEILCVPKLFQYHHIFGQCTSKSNKLFLSDLGHNPLLIKCKKCTHSYCVMCKARNHENHDYQYVLYQNPLFRCYTEKPIEETIDLSMFQQGKYPAKFTFIDSFGHQKSKSRFIDSPKLRITTIESCKAVATEGVYTILYYEVNVYKAGLQENIEIGIDGSGVRYRSLDGTIRLNGKVITKGPRYGSYDTIGIGVTNRCEVYITYNGLVNRPFVKCELADEYRPEILLDSETCDIDIKLRHWVFQPTMDKSPNQDFVNKEALPISDRLLVQLCGNIKKSYQKYPKDGKAQDVMEKYIEILKAVKRYDLIEKLEVKKYKFWPR